MPYETVYELTDSDLADLHERYRNYAWWDDRSLEDVRTALENTDVVAGLRDERTGELVAAGRVLTDFVYYGKIYDVIVAESHRGEGLGRDLLEAIVSHPDLENLEVLTLDCREGLVPFYEDCGFERHEMIAELPDGGEEDLVPMRYVGSEGDSESA
ncbi:GNAT family N-acetyltransferase [Halopiger aswanensis]|uniref:Acetyltransferase (GNAT) family protein n=1 Tax=Halopiger aswanensis TaxID=148449 RepID=A0A419WHA8_9EURY|nr:GNAT family N-acetyltransferase [Halopiger aswanensis]RKD94817.1 acetyltransferase (GNAT) family protein [Halopiger aswanensis]